MERSLEAVASPKTVRHGRWSGYCAILTARLKELYREPEVIFWIFLFPVLLAFGLGVAFRSKPAQAVRVAVVQQEEAGRVADWLRRGGGTALQVEVLSAEQAAQSFRLGKVDLQVVPRAGQVEYVYDTARPESVLARSLANEALQAAAGGKPAIATTARVNSEPGSRYIDFLIPGLLGMNLMSSGMWGIGFALVEMRQRKLMKRYVATPMRRGDFLLALASSRLVLMLAELVLLLGFGIFAFHLHMAGSWAAIFLVSCLGALAFAALGLLTASRAQKIETASGIMNVIMMPMWIFSGTFFSYERFPDAAIPFIRLLPLTALNDALRGVILEGTPLMAQAAPLAVLCAWGALSFAFALRWFRWS